MDRFEREFLSPNPSLTQVNQSLEMLNPDSSSTFMLFSNGVLFDNHHQFHFSVDLSHGDVGEKEKRGERRRKRKKDEEVMDNNIEKPRGDVVHVRAKRGQATDSHSLAERVRREKINERLKCLQELVPGCYKTMGMAVMLNVIIDYVRSLQNQIEFLSMKLAAASAFYDFNSLDIDEPMEILQGGNIYTADSEEMERMIREAQGAHASDFSSTWPF